MTEKELQDDQSNPDVVSVPVEAAQDECGPPEPVQGGGWPVRKTITTLACVVIGGAIFGIYGVATTPCMGATRSSRLLWEQRNQEIEKASTQEQAPQSSASQPSLQVVDTENE